MKNKNLQRQFLKISGSNFNILDARKFWPKNLYNILEESWPFLLLIFGALFVKICAPSFASTALENAFIEVYAKVDSGKKMELFINRNWNSPWCQQIVGKELYKYKFSKPPEYINSLRLDVTDDPGGSVYIKQVNVIAHNRKEYSLSVDPREIKLNNLRILNESQEGILFAVSGPDPWIMFRTDIFLKSSLNARIKNLILDFPLIIYLSILWGISNLMPTVDKMLPKIKILISSFFLFMIVQLTLPVVIASTRTLPSTTNAVGGAVFSGYSFAGTQRGFFWLVSLTLLFVALLFLVGRSQDKI